MPKVTQLVSQNLSLCIFVLKSTHCTSSQVRDQEKLSPPQDLGGLGIANSVSFSDERG